MNARKMKAAKYEPGISTMAFTSHKEPILKKMAKGLLYLLAAVSSFGVLVAVLGA